MRTRASFRRIHIWLGWIIGIPLLFWTVSGLWMAARPIHEVRGEHLKAGPPALSMNYQPVLPTIAIDKPFTSAKIVPQANGAVWIINFADKSLRRASARNGEWLPPVTEAEARNLATLAFAGNHSLVSAKHFDAQHPPLDLRKARPSWQIRFADDTHIYVDADTGEILAHRSKQWRIFDWMWGLHIMDLESRENTSHAILIGFAALAALSVLLALILLPFSRRKRSSHDS